MRRFYRRGVSAKSTEEGNDRDLLEEGGGAAGRLALLCGGGDRLIQWPALAWWAATFPGSAARGGVTVWVRVVAFAVRVVLCRAASVVAVDVDSFRCAAPPGHRASLVDLGEGAVEAGGGRRRRLGGGGRRGEEIKEDGLVVDGVVAADALDVVVADSAATDVRGDAGDAGDAAADVHADVNADVHGDVDVDVRGRVSSVGDDGNTPVERASAEVEAGGNAQPEAAVAVAGFGGGDDGGGGGGGGDVVVVLLPTHRSYLDFVLVSLLCAAMRSLPGLSWLRVPRVAAAEGAFGEQGSPLRWLLEKLGRLL